MKTCLYEKHIALGAKMVPFGGFDMPIEYSSITEEHQAVRQAAGMFDVSHMGEVLVSGKDSERFVNHIFTNQIADAPIGKIFYGMMLYPHGGVVDDLLVYKKEAQAFFLVINASNIEKDYAWMLEQAAGFDVKIENPSDSYCEIAVHGPKAVAAIETPLGLADDALAFYTFNDYVSACEPVWVCLPGISG